MEPPLGSVYMGRWVRHYAMVVLLTRSQRRLHTVLASPATIAKSYGLALSLAGPVMFVHILFVLHKGIAMVRLYPSDPCKASRAPS